MIFRRSPVVYSSSGYVSQNYEIELLSAASYFAAATITHGTVTLEGLNRESMQGDIEFCAALEEWVHR